MSQRGGHVGLGRIEGFAKLPQGRTRGLEDFRGKLRGELIGGGRAECIGEGFKKVRERDGDRRGV